MHHEPAPGFALVIGLDRSDQKVDLCQLGGSQAATHCSTVSTSPEALLSWVVNLRKDHPVGRIALCLEAPAGNLLAFFATHAPWLELYPVNPLTLKRFRETFVLSRANDDGKDALYLARLLQSHSDQLRRWRTEDPATARLQQLVAHRRAVIDERTALTNRLKALLKGYFPQALGLCGEELWRPLALAFLRRWPSLQSLRKTRPETLRSFYYLHGSRSLKLIEHRLALIQNAVALSEEPAVVECFSLRVGLVVRQLAALLPVVARYDRQIAQNFMEHPDAPIFSSLPGAGQVLAPRLLAALGSQRERYPTAAALQSATAVAPVTRQSGGKRHVSRRRHGALFLRQSFHEWARESVRHSVWAKAYYEQQRAKGCPHHVAVRSLAFKWQRIIWRCWQNRTPYSEEVYLNALKRAASPLASKLTPPLPPKITNNN
jgi:transposase